VKEYVKMAEIVKQTLETDSKFRYSGVADDLFGIDKINTNKSWDYSLPTIVYRWMIISHHQRKFRYSDKEFKSAFFKEHKLFDPSWSNFDWSNLLLAGGSVGDFIHGEKNKGDLDFFIYGLTPKQANERVKKFLQDIIRGNNTAYVKDENGDFVTEQVGGKTEKIKKFDRDELWNQSCFVRNNNAILVDGKYQLIFRLYSTKSEILHGFDIGSSAVGFDGSSVYLTTLSKFAYEYGCNIIDTTRRSTTYEKRLIKYFKRDFKIIMSHLNIGKLRTDYFKYGMKEVAQLPYFKFSYSNIIGNKIHFEKVFLDYSQNNSDYGMEDIDEDSLYGLFYQNLSNLLSNTGFLIYYSENSTNIDILDKPPYLKEAHIIHFYDELAQKLKGETFPHHAYKKWIKVRDLASFTLRVFVQGDDVKKVVDEVIDLQKRDVLERLKRLQKKNHSQIPWITKNPGTQLTSSFNPIIEDESKWYGKYYLK